MFSPFHWMGLGVEVVRRHVHDQVAVLYDGIERLEHPDHHPDVRLAQHAHPMLVDHRIGDGKTAVGQSGESCFIDPTIEVPLLRVAGTFGEVGQGEVFHGSHDSVSFQVRRRSSGRRPDRCRQFLRLADDPLGDGHAVASEGIQ